MSTQTFTIEDYHLARRAGGMSYNPAIETAEQGAVRSALEYARDLYALRRDPDVWVTWGESDLPWDGDIPMEPGTVLLDAYLWAGDDVNGSRVVASLGCVNVYSETDEYCRIVEAELYGEYLYEQRAEHEREAREESERAYWAARDVMTV